jgi:predicted lipoprotein with Yx(FWY)xxD motif
MHSLLRHAIRLGLPAKSHPWRSLSSTGLVLPVIVAACGSAATVAGPQAATATATPAAGTVTVTSNATLGAILATGDGRTLYRFTAEMDGKVACTGACAAMWPALIASAPTAGPGLTDPVGVVALPDGRTQVTYHEWPLHTYVGDNKPGDTAGQGLFGQWFVVSPSAALDANGDFDGTTPAPTPPPTAPAAPAAPRAAPATMAPAMTCIPQHGAGDGDGDNVGGRSDGDGCR